MDFEKDIAIDKFKLDIEWEHQPTLFAYYARKNAEAIAERDRVWQNIKVVKAELMAKILNFHKEQGSKKPTDVAIDAEIRNSDEHKDASENLIDANENVALTDAAKWAIQQKRDALENMVKLFLAGYWADPKIPPEAKEQADQKTTRKLKRSLNK